MIRTIVEERTKNVAVMDVFSKLIQERIIFIDEEIDSELANGVIAQMIYLDSVDSKKPINVYINTPGGSVYDGLAIYDISRLIKAPIRTVSMGLVASMGIILMLMGTERCATKNCAFMIHQPSTMAYGPAADIEITAKMIISLKEKMFQIISEHTGQPADKIKTDAERDYWLSVDEAKEYGLITKIL
jgi:ATP-dependent Clp protease protease subunit